MIVTLNIIAGAEMILVPPTPDNLEGFISMTFHDGAGDSASVLVPRFRAISLARAILADALGEPAPAVVAEVPPPEPSAA